VIDRLSIMYLKYAHGLFNLTMAVLFLYQGWTGFAVRRARRAGGKVPFDRVRAHRKSGPALELGGLAGYLVGIGVVILDRGRLFEYPLHLATGTVLVGLMGVVYAVSRRIEGTAVKARSLHFRIGSALLALYVLQVFIGFSVLF
jgi:hypothetical protein